MFRWLHLALIWFLALAAGFAAFVRLAPGNVGGRDLDFYFDGSSPMMQLVWNGMRYQIGELESIPHLVCWSRLKYFGELDDRPNPFVIGLGRAIPRIERPFRTWRWHSLFLSHGDSDANPSVVYRNTQVEFPCWFAVSALSAYPCLAFFRGPVRRWHRRRHGRCVKCAYDLTGLPEPRCPECGEGVKGRTVPGRPSGGCP